MLDPEIVGSALESRCCHVYKLKSTYLYLHFQFSAAIFDLPVTSTSKRIHTSPIVLLDPENVGVGFGISLLSCIQAEIYDIAYVLPVNGGHVWFTSHPDVEEYISPTVLLDPENEGVVVEIP